MTTSGARPEKRRDARVSTGVRVAMATMDPVRDPVTHEICYHTSEDEAATNLSRRGIRLRCHHAPGVGTRVLLQIHLRQEEPPIEVIGRTCWTGVEFAPGERGARPCTAVGVELLGGSRAALARYERWLAAVGPEDGPSVAGAEVRG